MRTEYDFSRAKRGALIPSKGKSRITIYIDDAVLAEFRTRAEQAGTGYQTMMNEALKAYLSQAEPPVTETVLRRVIREELPKVKRRTPRSIKIRAKVTRADYQVADAEKASPFGQEPDDLERDLENARRARRT